MTRIKALTLTAAALLWAALPAFVYAQRGMGDPTGVARQGIVPKPVNISGKLVAVQTNPCEKTTGRALVGTHLDLKTATGKEFNVHLGPATVLEPIVKQLVVGQQIDVVAFRTEKIPKGQYVAKSLTFAGKTVQLRDDNLRPAWAGGRSAWYGPRGGANYGMGRGPGRGRGRGWGRGRGSGRGNRSGPGY